MNILPFIISLVIVALIVLAALYAPSRRKLVALANIADGRWPGTKGYYTDAVVSSPNLLCTAGSTDRHVAICGVGDVPRGVMDDEADAIGDLINVRLLGLVAETELGVASGAITEEDELVAGAAGTVRTLPVASGTYYIIGRALADAADTETAHYAPQAPVQRVVA